MRNLKTVIRQLQDVLDQILGAAAPFQPLPETYFQQPDWHQAAQSLQQPAVWRRSLQVR